MRRSILLLLALVASGCPDEKSSSTTDGATTDGATTGVTTGVTSTAGSTGEPTTSGTTGVLPEGSCRTQADCDDIGQCDSPGAVQCGGATGCVLNGMECADDPACGGTPQSPMICVPDPCCGLSLCQPGCLTDMDCGPAQRCGADARCAAASCDAMAVCPAGYTCVDKTCAPTPCTSDAMCEGYCVNGACSAVLGSCSYPTP
jgi:hypothetical protein